MTIGAVLEDLRADFPDISVSKIRFLEAEGLIAPERTAAGYRLFTDADVSRLRYVLVAQRDRFWPLKVIREALDALDRGLAGPDEFDRPGPPAAVTDPALPSARTLRRTSTLRLTVTELQDATGLTSETVESLRSFAVLTPSESGHYDDDQLAIARAAATLSAYGVQARHLRPFRSAADREIGLVEQILGSARPDRRPGQPDPHAEVLAACVALHVALVKAGLSE